MQINPNSGFNTQEMIYTKRKLLDGESAIEQIESELTRLPEPPVRIAEEQSYTISNTPYVVQFAKIPKKVLIHFLLAADPSTEQFAVSICGTQIKGIRSDGIENTERNVIIEFPFDSVISVMNTQLKGTNYTSTTTVENFEDTGNLEFTLAKQDPIYPDVETDFYIDVIY